MTQRSDFSLLTNVGNVADPVLSQDTATKNYVDTRPSGSGNPGIWFAGSGAPTNIVGAVVGNYYADTTNVKAYILTAVVSSTQTWTAQPNLDSYVQAYADKEIVTNIGSIQLSSFEASTVQTTTQAFGTGTASTTTCDIATASFSAGQALLTSLGFTLSGNNWTAGSAPAYLAISTTPTSTQYALIQSAAQNAGASILQLTLADNPYLESRTNQGPFTISTAQFRFIFQPAPLASIDREIDGRTVNSLNSLQRVVQLASPDNSVQISTSGQNINLRTLGSGGASSISIDNFGQVVKSNINVYSQIELVPALGWIYPIYFSLGTGTLTTGWTNSSVQLPFFATNGLVNTANGFTTAGSALTSWGSGNPVAPQAEVLRSTYQTWHNARPGAMQITVTTLLANFSGIVLSISSPAPTANPVQSNAQISGLFTVTNLTSGNGITGMDYANDVSGVQYPFQRAQIAGSTTSAAVATIQLSSRSATVKGSSAANIATINGDAISYNSTSVNSVVADLAIGRMRLTLSWNGNINATAPASGIVPSLYFFKENGVSDDAGSTFPGFALGTGLSAPFNQTVPATALSSRWCSIATRPLITAAPGISALVDDPTYGSVQQITLSVNNASLFTVGQIVTLQAGAGRLTTGDASAEGNWILSARNTTTNTITILFWDGNARPYGNVPNTTLFFNSSSTIWGSAVLIPWTEGAPTNGISASTWNWIQYEVSATSANITSITYQPNGFTTPASTNKYRYSLRFAPPYTAINFLPTPASTYSAYYLELASDYTNYENQQDIFLQGGSGGLQNLQSVLNIGNSASNSSGNIATIVLNDTANLTKPTVLAQNKVESRAFQLDGSTAGAMQLTVPATTTNYSLVLPSAQAPDSAGDTLLNDGGGNLSWVRAGNIFFCQTDYIVTAFTSGSPPTLTLTTVDGRNASTTDFTIGDRIIIDLQAETIIPNPIIGIVAGASATQLVLSMANGYTFTLNRSVYVQTAQGIRTIFDFPFNKSGNRVRLITNNTLTLIGSGGDIGKLSVPSLSIGATSTTLSASVSSGASADLILSAKGTGRVQTTSGLQLNGATSGNVFLNAPATVTTYNLVLPALQGGANTVLTNDGSGNLSWQTGGGGGGSPGGANTQVQYNNSGAFGGSANFTWTNSTNNLSLGDAILDTTSAVLEVGNFANYARLRYNGTTMQLDVLAESSGTAIARDLVISGTNIAGTTAPIRVINGVSFNSSSSQSGVAYNAPLLAGNASTPTALTAGSAGQILTSNGAGNSPYWSSGSGSVQNLQNVLAGGNTATTAVSGIRLFNDNPTALNFGTITGGLTLSGVGSGAGSGTSLVRWNNDGTMVLSGAKVSIGNTATSVLEVTPLANGITLGVPVVSGQVTTVLNIVPAGSFPEIRMGNPQFTYILFGPTASPTATVASFSATNTQSTGILALNADLYVRMNKALRFDSGLSGLDAYTVPIRVANAISPTAFSDGTSGQVLTSRGAGLTPAWITPNQFSVVRIAADTTLGIGGTNVQLTLDSTYNGLNLSITSGTIVTGLISTATYLVTLSVRFYGTGTNSNQWHLFSSSTGITSNPAYLSGVVHFMTNLSLSDLQTGSTSGLVTGQTSLRWISYTSNPITLYQSGSFAIIERLS